MHNHRIVLLTLFFPYTVQIFNIISMSSIMTCAPVPGHSLCKQKLPCEFSIEDEEGLYVKGLLLLLTEESPSSGNAIQGADLHF